MTTPVPWSLAWREDGELAPQDRFDLLQSLVTTERSEVQSALIAAVESLTMDCSAMAELTHLALGDVTGLCA